LAGAIELVFETHAMTVDNEQGRATGWLPGELSEQGRIQARQLGRRRTGDHITAVFSSDLVRAAQTALVAFGRSANPVLHDWWLRQCDYGQRNGMPAAELHASRREYLPGRGKLAAGHNPASAASSAICHCAGTASGSWSSVMSPPGGAWTTSSAASAGRPHRSGLRLARRMGIPGQLATAVRKPQHSNHRHALWQNYRSSI
jgi:hypothetical protein